MEKEQQMAKQKEDSQDWWKENKQVPKADSSKCAQQEQRASSTIGGELPLHGVELLSFVLGSFEPRL